MTPSLGVTPDEAQLPAGPQPTGVAIFGQFPVLWAGLSGEQIWGLGLPEEWVLGLDLSLGGPLTPLSSSPIAVNISTKWKRKKKRQKKVRKSHHLKPPGTCSPGQPGLSPEQSRGQPWPPGLPVCVHPSQGGQPPEQLLHSRDKTNLEATAKQRTCPSQHRSITSALAALLGRVPHCLPQDQRPVSPCPAGQETPSHPKMLLPRWLHYPFEFLLLVYHFRTHGRQEEAGIPP